MDHPITNKTIFRGATCEKREKGEKGEKGGSIH